MMLFTDGACEPDRDGQLQGTIGGVLLGCEPRRFFFFAYGLALVTVARLSSAAASPIA